MHADLLHCYNTNYTVSTNRLYVKYKSNVVQYMEGSFICVLILLLWKNKSTAACRHMVMHSTNIYICCVQCCVYCVYFLEEAITALYRPERGGWYFTESNIYELVGGRPTWPIYARPRLYGPKGLQPKSCTGLRVFRPHWISLNPIERRVKYFFKTVPLFIFERYMRL